MQVFPAARRIMTRREERQMSNILVLMASHRSPGNSEILARQAAAGAACSGAQIELLNISKMRISTCEGCLRCVFQGKCGEQDEMGELVNKMLAADGLIVAAPIYLLAPASLIKKAMDRALMMSLYLDELEGRRRGAVTIAVAGKEDWNPIGMEVLNQFAYAYGFPVFDYLEAYAPGPGEILLQEQVMEKAGRLGEGLVAYLHGKAPARKPAANQCPSCYSRSFRLLGGNRIKCSFCLVEGTLDGSGNVQVAPELLADAFWTPKHRKRHLEEWIKATRGSYLKNRELVKEKLQQFLAVQPPATVKMEQKDGPGT